MTKTAKDFLPEETIIKNGFDDPSAYRKELLSFLEAKRGEMMPLEDTGHDTRFGFLWNRFINGEKMEKYQTDILLDSVFYGTMTFIDCLGSDDMTERKAKALLSFMDDGFCRKFKDGRPVPLPDCSEECSKSGIRISFAFPEPFRPVAYRREDGELVPVEPFQDFGIQHVEIPCPSGRLIAADWIRLDEFTDFYRNLTSQKLISVNNDAGRIEHAFRAAKNGFIDIMIDDGSAQVAQRGNTLVVCRDAKHVDGFSDSGEICTDRWSFACIDRQVLEDIIAKEGVSDPKKAVDDYLKENEHHSVIEISVEPGTYHAYFMGNEQKFDKSFACDEIPRLGKENKALIVISDHPLVLEERKENKTAKKRAP